MNLHVAEASALYRVQAAVPDLDRAAVDARVLWLFDNATLNRQLDKLDKLELSSVWRLTEQALGPPGRGPRPSR